MKHGFNQLSAIPTRACLIKIKSDISTDKKASDMVGKHKQRRKNKSDFGPNFVAPDGGYAWVVCAAVGLSNVNTTVLKMIDCI